jgi:hypothetical protein
MSQLTYRPELECQVPAGNGGATVEVCVADINGQAQCRHVARGYLTGDPQKPYLPVEVLVWDYREDRAFVDLPGTSQSGPSRIWVPLHHLRPEDRLIA